MSDSPWQGAVIALGVTVVAMPALLMGLRRWKVVDQPNDRSSHRRPTLRGGGLAPALGVLVGLGILAGAGGVHDQWLVAAGLVGAGFGAIGLTDDLAGVEPRLRLVLQVLVAVAGLVGLARGIRGPTVWIVVFCLGVVLWLVAFVNAFNFMDGINGISGAQVVVAGSAWWAIGATEHAWALAAGGALVLGAAVGFLPFNAPRPVVFLGDVGSYFLGGLLAALVVVGVRSGLPPEAVGAPLFLYLADTAITIARRVRAGETWHQAHRRHAYQRLTQLRWSHMTTTLLVAAVMVVTSALGAVSLSSDLPGRAAADLAILAILVAYLAAPALAARRMAKRMGSEAGVSASRAPT